MKYISPIDWNLDQYLWQIREGWLAQFFFYFTELAEWRVVAGLVAIFAVFFWVKKEKGKVQHKGYGKLLLNKAEEIAEKNNKNKSL